MATRERIVSCAQAVESLAPAVSVLSASASDSDSLRHVVDDALHRGHFSPSEDDQLWAWYARYLTARQGLQEVVHELRPEGEAAEDILGMAVFGVRGTRRQLVSGERAGALIARSLEPSAE